MRPFFLVASPESGDDLRLTPYLPTWNIFSGSYSPLRATSCLLTRSLSWLLPTTIPVLAHSFARPRPLLHTSRKAAGRPVHFLWRPISRVIRQRHSCSSAHLGLRDTGGHVRVPDVHRRSQRPASLGSAQMNFPTQPAFLTAHSRQDQYRPVTAAIR